MKALSICCQNAYLISLGIKDVENRTWKTDYRGELLIHSSGKDCDEIDIRYFPIIWQKAGKEALPEDIRRKLDNFYEKLYAFYGTKDYQEWKKKEYYMKAQAIIGKVNLVDIVKDSQSAWAESGQYHWVLQNAELFKTPLLFVKGMLSLWEYEREVSYGRNQVKVEDNRPGEAGKQRQGAGVIPSGKIIIANKSHNRAEKAYYGFFFNRKR